MLHYLMDFIIKVYSTFLFLALSHLSSVASTRFHPLVLPCSASVGVSKFFLLFFGSILINLLCCCFCCIWLIFCRFCIPFSLCGLYLLLHLFFFIHMFLKFGSSQWIRTSILKLRHEFSFLPCVVALIIYLYWRFFSIPLTVNCWSIPFSSAIFFLFNKLMHGYENFYLLAFYVLPNIFFPSIPSFFPFPVFEVLKLIFTSFSYLL